MIPANVALVAWIPVVLIMFSLWPARQAVLYAIIGGMLLLPEGGHAFVKLPGLFYTKLAAISIAALLGVALFDGARLFAFRFAWYDLFWLVLSLSSIVTSLLNGLGPKDGVVECIGMWMVWSIPYFIGRLYLTDIHAVREAAVAIVQAGILYAVLCLIEVRFSPQMHQWVYGYHQHSFAQTYRLGGYRPMVFMQHGLAVGLFMAAVTLICFWLWRCGTVREIWGMPTGWAAVGLAIVTVLCKSTGALMLMGLGGLALLAIYQWRAAWPLTLLIAVAPLYMLARGSGLFDGKLLVGAVAQVTNEDRAGSLKFRIDAENVLARKALQQPLFGWGGWQRSRALNANGVGIAVTDGLWIIQLGKKGIVGVVGLFGAFLVGPALLRRRFDPKLWTHPAVGPAVASAVVVCIHMIDSLPNGMPNAIYYFLGGGLAGMAGYARTVAGAAASPFTNAARSRAVTAPANVAVAARTTVTTPNAAPVGGKKPAAVITITAIGGR